MTSTEPRPIGFGRLQRKEDARFIRGQGRFVDDVTVPGMLHGAVLRSPVAHARIVSIDTSAALAHPKVVAVLTGRDLETRNMATRKRAAMIVDAQQDVIGRMWREGAPVQTAVAHLTMW